MFLRIEKGSSTPVSRQIAEQIATLCASGSLSSGMRLPSVRELGKQLGVNQNTVLRVYERLARDGLVEMRQGQGTFVADQMDGQAAQSHRTRLLEELRQLVRQCDALGMSGEQIHGLLQEAIDSSGARVRASIGDPSS